MKLTKPKLRQIIKEELGNVKMALEAKKQTDDPGDITFEVRASDTAFRKDDATPSWTAVGGTSPVLAGLPSGRYMQWRATLTSSDFQKAPTLFEVTIAYY